MWASQAPFALRDFTRLSFGPVTAVRRKAFVSYRRPASKVANDSP